MNPALRAAFDSDPAKVRFILFYFRWKRSASIIFRRRLGFRCNDPIARFEHESDAAFAPGHRTSREPEGGVRHARAGNGCGGGEIKGDFNEGGRIEPIDGEGA